MSYNNLSNNLANFYQEYNFKENEEIALITDEYSQGRYYITNYSNVLSLCQNKWHLLKQTIDKDGYYYVSFQYKDKRIKKHTHRLVAEYFVYNPAPQEKTIVHHIDGNRKNNYFLNLQWCDTKEHSSLHQKRSIDNERTELA